MTQRKVRGANPPRANNERLAGDGIFARLLPIWLLYPLVVSVLGALTGLAGWMMQNGLRRVWSLLTVAGIATQLGGLALLWQRWGWQRQIAGSTDVTAPAPQKLARTHRRVGRLARGLLLAGGMLAIWGSIGAARDRHLPTLP